HVKIQGSRHPVIEKVMNDGMFVPNDFYLDENQQVLLITGPNMSGKSTYMRQLALTIIMGQIGCFVPADEAELVLFDQIFTRSEERRVGKECRSRWSPYNEKKKVRKVRGGRTGYGRRR